MEEDGFPVTIKTELIDPHLFSRFEQIQSNGKAFLGDKFIHTSAESNVNEDYSFILIYLQLVSAKL